MRKIGILTTTVLCSAILLGGVIYWSQTSRKNLAKTREIDQTLELNDIKKADQLLLEGRVEEALKIIHNYEEQIGLSSETARAWLDLLIVASVKKGNLGQLILLYEAYPRAFDDNERASIMVADAYILSQRPQDYEVIREFWRSKATMLDMWIALDADALLLEGKKEEAMSLLQTSKFEGSMDIERLVRLALLNTVDNPKKAWDYLAEAYSLDPKNTEIISYRGKLLESLGKDSLALYEYLAAIQADPNNVFLRDQLAEFYMRHNKANLAFPVWLEAIKQSSLDAIWIKILFWSKVLTPVTFDWAAASPPTGIDKAFIDYLQGLPQNSFWDESAFNSLSKAKTYLNTIQATFWLRLLDDLKKGDEREAWNLLQYNTFSKALINPQLEMAIKQILSYRMTGFLNESASLPSNEPKKAQEEEVHLEPGDGNFFQQLEAYAKKTGEDPQAKLPAELHELLMGKDAFAAPFLAAGWFEAALQLHKIGVIPPSYPDWVAYALTEAYRTNRSAAEALKFATSQKKTPSLSLLIAELYIGENRPDEALAVLLPIASEDSDIGRKAAWLAGVIYADKQDYDKAKAMIEAQAGLADDPTGKEALARIALLQGDTELADKLYSQIQDSSAEAMSYFARKAFAEKNWDRAQELTEQLLLLFPDSPILRDNLNKIIEEKKGKESP